MPRKPAQVATLDPQLLIAQAMSEQELLDIIRDLADVLRWQTAHIRDARGQRLTGLPDLLLVRRPRLIWAELKAYDRRARAWRNPTPDQQRWLDELRACGQEAYLWTSLEWVNGEIERVLK